MSEQAVHIHRAPKPAGTFYTAHRGYLDDPRLSFKAKGVMTYLLSKPDGWKLNISDLMAHATDQEHAIRSGLAELREHGYASYRQPRVGNHFGPGQWHIWEVPELQEQAGGTLQATCQNGGFLDTGPLDAENHHHSNNDSSNNDSSNNYTDGAVTQPPLIERPEEEKALIRLMASKRLSYDEAAPLFQALEEGRRIDGKKVNPVGLLMKIMADRYRGRLTHIDAGRLGKVWKSAKLKGMTAEDVAALITRNAQASGDPYAYLQGMINPDDQRRASQSERVRAAKALRRQTPPVAYGPESEGF